MSRVLAKRRLVAHMDFPPPQIDLTTKVTLVGSDVLKLEYVIVGKIPKINFPPFGLPERTDNLWKHSCFEAFVEIAGDEEYLEFNFSPSRQWAIYRFDSYRDGISPAIDLPAPDIYLETDNDVRFALTAWIDLKSLERNRPWDLGLSAIIEETGGTKSYWALNHPPGKPDFHHRDCFALRLEAPSTT